MEKTIYSTTYRTLILWLKECREAKGLTMRELAQQLEVAHSWVGKVEQMERRLDVFEYVRLCECLDVNPALGLKKLQ